MDLRSHNPYWLLKNGIISNYPSLTKDIRTDVVVVGAGITGALVASSLCKKGFRVVVVDKRHVGMGSTAASTSLLQYEIDTPLRTLAGKVGEKNAARSYHLCINAIDELEKICARLPENPGFSRKESFQYASSKKDVPLLRQEFALRKKHGIGLRWLDEQHIRDTFGFSAPAGVVSRDGAQVDAYRLTHALLEQGKVRGLNVYDNTEIVRITRPKDKPTLTTHLGHTIKARHLVIACGYESQKYLPKQVEELSSTYAIVSEPDGIKHKWYKNCLIWETATPYLYLRTTDDNRVLVGGKDDAFYDPYKRDRNIPRKVKMLEKAFARLFPHLPFTTDFQWAGTFASTKDGLPYIGSVKQRTATSFALGFGGNGITFSVIAARLIADRLTGKVNRDAPLFSFDR